MDRLAFYKEVSEESGYDEVLVRVVWNHLWKTIKEEFKESPLIDIDDLGEFHLDMKRSKSFIKAEKANEELIEMYEKALTIKKLKNLLKDERDIQRINKESLY